VRLAASSRMNSIPAESVGHRSCTGDGRLEASGSWCSINTVAYGPFANLVRVLAAKSTKGRGCEVVVGEPRGLPGDRPVASP